ncbi:VWA domain-containing protein [Croceitalea sp. P059]|uniref:vWA domain-containing protein n=1 Tax=Croceitalea sp. P059 TaxID=3075601 RepID=UPI002887CEE1|nr:VWA domain-containing protein [Croceitalea sp. P059]MDT0539643.1 VWA domain-containing protein [Croceitalea sp. P059]
MQITTVVFLFLAALVSLVFAWFQYFFKKKRNSTNLLLGFLRFLMVFALLVLLINPKFVKNSFYIEKADLIIAIDNSTSINSFNAGPIVESSLNNIIENKSILERFNVFAYSFGEKLNEIDSLTFKEPVTNIAKALSTLNEVSDQNDRALILLTDGNQTLGSDYEFQNLKNQLNIYPIVLGDTTAYEDIRIGQINYNNYAFLGNKYPIEMNISYEGKKAIQTKAKILVNNQEVYRNTVSFDATNNNITLRTLIDAKKVGVKNLRVQIESLENEKNTANNFKNLVVEVIDEKTNIAIISSIKHPDMGVLKKAIEVNEQRAVTIVEPKISEIDLDDTDLFILYQPNRNFQSVYDFIKRKGGSIFTITGPKTDWQFLNNVQNSFSKEIFNQNEDIVPSKNEAFGLFDLGSISFDDYPPLKSTLGEITLAKTYEAISFQKIKGVVLNQPLFLVINDDKAKEAILFGEGLWKWRVQSYRANSNFDAFDNFIGKLMFYLSDSKQKSRLELDYERIYDGIATTVLKAKYFDETYYFDSGASLELKLSKSNSSENFERPLLLKSGEYEADLNDLEAGVYSFVVTVNEENISKEGRFTILDFDLESQFSSSNVDKLKRLAQSNNGQTFYPEETDKLIETLLSKAQFTPTQKSTKNVVSLIDFRWLLAIIAITLAAEWFIRKYNGLL